MSASLLPLASGRPPAGADLLRIVHINEQIKRVVGVSFKINIMALNAIFLAKRAGTAARGFGVLSNELRVFSQDLRTCMASLTRLIDACVNEVSVVLQDNRQMRLLGKAAELAPQQPALSAVRRRRSRASEEDAQQLGRLRRQLKRALEDAFQMVELGGGVAKSARQARRILFSGDVGAALLPPGQDGLFVEHFDAHIRHAEAFHKRWMGSNEAKRRWCERVAQLDIDMLCPQHGAIYRGADVQRFINWFDEIQVGGVVNA